MVIVLQRVIAFFVMFFILCAVTLANGSALSCRVVLGSLGEDHLAVTSDREHREFENILNLVQDDLSAIFNEHSHAISTMEFPDNLAKDLTKHLESIAVLREYNNELYFDFLEHGDFSRSHLNRLRQKVDEIANWLRGPYQSYIIQKETADWSGSFKKKSEKAEDSYPSAIWDAIMQDPSLINAGVVYKIPSLVYPEKFISVEFGEKVVEYFFQPDSRGYKGNLPTILATLNAIQFDYQSMSSVSKGIHHIYRPSGSSEVQKRLYKVKIHGRGGLGAFRMGGYKHGEVLHLVHWSFDSNHESANYKASFEAGIVNQMILRGHR